MNLCCSYKSNPSCLQKVDEIRYTIGALGAAILALETYPTKMIIIEILDLEKIRDTYNKLVALANENENIVIDCYKLRDFIIISEDQKIKRLMYHYPVNNYTDMWRILYYKPWAITIAEPLTFDLPKMRQAVEKLTDNYTRVRVLPVLGRPTDWNSLFEIDNGIKHFWITPNTMEVFEPFINTLDLYDDDQYREEALVNVFSAGAYTMPLGSLIKNLNSTIPADMINEEFMQKRLSCHQMCMRDPNICTYCPSFEKITQLTQPETKSLLEILK